MSSPLTPMSWKLSSVKRQPLWHLAQAALVLNTTKPRLASGVMAASSPASQRSNGASGDTTPRSKVAMALATVSGATGSPG